jgi:hypothetical protein
MFRFTVKDIGWLTLAVALALGWTTHSLVWPRFSPKRLQLFSGYSESGWLSGMIKSNVRSIELSVQLDGIGGGTGLLALDPNWKTYDRFGNLDVTTLIGHFPQKVTFREALKVQGRGTERAYEIVGHKLNGKLILVAPGARSSPYLLLGIDQRGVVTEVLILSTNRL